MADNSAMLVVGVIVVVLITAGLTYYITKSAEQLPQNQTNVSLEKPSITVRGEATKTVSPDLMVIGLTIDSFGNNTSASQAQSATDTAKVKAALLAAGLSASEIQTSSYYTYPVYNDSCYDYCYPYAYDYAVPAGGGVYKGDAPSSEPAMESGSGAAGSGVAYPDIYPRPYPCKSECNITGYKTSHVLMIKTDKVNDAGDLVDAALGAGDFKIDYIYFSVKDETRVKVESDLQAAAASNAKSKAENIAKGLGATLGKVISVTTDYYPIYPYPVYAYDRSAYGGEAAPPTEIFPTDSSFSGSITVTYELEQ
ncbi:MAG: SIMPL domain-containing protein [Candidatus Micrarchaeota archaeon]